MSCPTVILVQGRVSVCHHDGHAAVCRGPRDGAARIHAGRQLQAERRVLRRPARPLCPDLPSPAPTGWLAPVTPPSLTLLQRITLAGLKTHAWIVGDDNYQFGVAAAVQGPSEIMARMADVVIFAQM